MTSWSLIIVHLIRTCILSNSLHTIRQQRTDCHLNSRDRFLQHSLQETGVFIFRRTHRQTQVPTASSFHFQPQSYKMSPPCWVSQNIFIFRALTSVPAKLSCDSMHYIRLSGVDSFIDKSTHHTRLRNLLALTHPNVSLKHILLYLFC